MNEVKAELNSRLNNGDVIVLGLSGGPDSMCLLDLLLNINKKIKIIAAHVNHNLREESINEALMVKDYCTNNNVIYEYMEIKEYKGNIENCAREKRYEFFEKLVEKYHAKYLLTAHHADDLMETMLMRLSRGVNLSSLKGFNLLTKRKNYYIYRPLIYVTKENIINYLDKRNIKYAVDKTNKEDAYTRNRFRKYMLPVLKKENKNIHKNFLKISEEINEYDNYIEKIVNNKIKEIYINKKINIVKLNKEEDLIRKKIIYSILKDIYKENIFKIKNKHIDQIIKSLDSKKANIIINLPDNMLFIKSYNESFIKKNEKKTNYNLIFNNNLTLPNGHMIKMVEDTNDNSNYVLKINSKQISMPLHVRTRKNGDKMEVKGLNGSKKIKDIFIDEKINKEDRDNIPIVTDNNDNIIWLPGIKKSKFDTSKTKNYDIIIKYF